MAWIDIDLLKQHVRADDFSDDDEYLYHLIEAVEHYILTATNRTEDELKVIGGGDIPPELKHACLMVAGHWYDERSAVSGVQKTEVPYSIQAIVKPFRKLV